MFIFIQVMDVRYLLSYSVHSTGYNSHTRLIKTILQSLAWLHLFAAERLQESQKNLN